MRDLLFLAHRIPYPPNKGDKLRSYHLLRQLSRHFRIHLGCFVDDKEDWRHVAAVKEMCADTCFVPLRPWRSRLRSMGAIAAGKSLSLRYYRHSGLAHWVGSIIEREKIDCALIFSSAMAQYVERFGALRRVADLVDVDSVKWEQYAKDVSWPLSWLYAREANALFAVEREVAVTFDATVFVSKAEADLFRSLAPNSAEKVLYSGNGVDAQYFDPELKTASPYASGARVLVFTGAMDYKPNIDAVEWFAREAFPAVHRQWSDARFAIVGARPSQAVRKLANRPGVLVTGTVPDIRPYLAHATAVVAPLRIARGVQNKVLEGMAMGRTVIASSDAAQGIYAEPGREVLIADSAEQYAAAISAVFEGSHDIGKSARKRILESYSWVKNLDKIRELLEEGARTAGAIGSHAAAAA
jgi:sugar transferase (PEP-CTERM/EpsH1 system associated)